MLPMLVALLTLAPLRALVAAESGLSLPLSIDQVLLLVYGLVWLAAHALQRRRMLRLERNPTLLATLGLTAAFAIGAWTSVSPAEWLTEWLKWAIIAGFVWHLSLLRGERWRWLVFAVAISTAGNALVGLYIFVGGSGADHLQILGRFYRAFGTFGQPNPFGGFMGIALPVCAMAAWGMASKTWTSWRDQGSVTSGHVAQLLAWTAGAGLLAAALLASWSRGAWLGIAGAALAMLFALPRKLLHGLLLVICLCGLVAGLWRIGALPDALMGRLTSSISDLVSITDVRGIDVHSGNYAVIERLAHWQAAVNMAQDFPFFGVGLGNYSAQYEQYRLIAWELPLGHAHNYYLNVLAEAGILGLLAYLAFWAVMLRLSWTLRGHPDQFARAVGVGLLGCWAYIAVHSFFDNLYVNTLFLHIGVLLSVQAILHRQLQSALVVE